MPVNYITYVAKAKRVGLMFMRACIINLFVLTGLCRLALNHFQYAGKEKITSQR